MHYHVAKWGNSLAIRIPLSLAKQIDINAGSEILLSVENNQLLIRKKEYLLEELLQQITPENIHEEINFGTPVGKEIW